MGKINVAKVSEVAPGAMKLCSIEGHDDIVLANVAGTFYAMRGVCNHAGGPLAEGTLEGEIVICPWHGSKWDLKTGKCTEFPVELDPEPIYTVSLEGDDVFVEI